MTMTAKSLVGVGVGVAPLILPVSLLLLRILLLPVPVSSSRSIYTRPSFSSVLVGFASEADTDVVFQSGEVTQDPNPNKTQLLVAGPMDQFTLVLASTGRPEIDVPDDAETSHANPVRFFLYTHKNPADNPEELMIGSNSLLENSNFVPGVPLKIIVHGFGKTALSGHSQRFKSAYLEGNRQLNVVLVDWKKMAMRPRYDRAAANSKIVGEAVAQFILFLVQRGVVQLEDVHLIGHSLGAHVAGFAGRDVGAGKIGRITALDPAAPLFTSVSSSRKVDQSDAAFVDVIHTGAGIIALKKPQGHADFYPNGGESQPGCGFFDWPGTCKHKRAHYYMLESINNPESFLAWKCPSWALFSRRKCYNNDIAHMGEHVSRSASGTYYLKTNSKEPFSF